MKDKKVLAGLFVLFILLVTGMVLFLPRPIVNDADEVVVQRIQYNPDFSQDGAEADFMEIEDYDAEKIAECLSNYRERRTMTKAESYQLDNVEIRIIISVNGEMREILLGKENSSRGGYGTYQYEIINAEKLCEELKRCFFERTDENNSFMFTKEEFLADYDMMWETLEKNYYFFPILENKGIDIEALKNSTRQQLMEKVEDLDDFRSLLGKMFMQMEHFAHLGLVGTTTFNTYQKLYNTDGVKNNGWQKVLQNQQTQELYQYLKEQETQVSEEEFEYPEVKCSYDIERKAVIFKIATFTDAVVERDEDFIRGYVETLGDVEIDHVIFDLSGNGGGNDMYWMENIVEPFGEDYEWTDWLYVRDTEMMISFFFDEFFSCSPEPVENISGHPLPGFVEELGLTHYIANFQKLSSAPSLPKNVLDASRWIIIDGGVCSSAENFVEFCKEMEWATLVGQPTLGDGSGITPVLYALPNTGLLIRFRGTAGENPDGTLNTLAGTKPDVFVRPSNGKYFGKSSLEVIKQMIDDEKKQY